MNELRIFQNPEFGVVRTVVIEGEIWFVGKDVAIALGYKDTVSAIKQHVDEDDKKPWKITTPSRGTQTALIINESGLYSLSFGSQLESAKRFKRWVTSEILPSIRKHGGYILNQDTMTDDELLEKALLVAQSRIAERDKIISQQHSEILEKDKRIAVMRPESEYYRAVCDARLLTNFRDAGKQLGMSQSQFTGYLKSNGYIYATNKGELRPTEPYRASGLFQMKSYVNRYSGFSGIRTYLTPKGVQYFKMQFETNEIIPEALPKHGGRKGTRK